MITFEEAGFSYADTPILKNVSLNVEPGSFHFLTGPSGAGKTTFLRLCYLALRPTSGRVVHYGRDAATASRDDITRIRRKLGVMHQNCTFLDHLSVAENVILPLDVTERRQSQSERNRDELLDWVGLSTRSSAKPPELSGGERQRVALARAVMSSPDVLIADEPTGNLDRDMADRLLMLLIELNRLGKAVIVATHDIALIRAAKGQVAARVLRLKGGSLSQAGAEL
ncbi:MAG: ATP-binding cassette domain-containing protein [Pseudomonadota bacterium]